MKNQNKIINFMLREQAYLLEIEKSYVANLNKTIDEFDDFAIAMDESDDNRVLN
jgi:hypothetical protein